MRKLAPGDAWRNGPGWDPADVNDVFPERRPHGGAARLADGLVAWVVFSDDPARALFGPCVLRWSVALCRADRGEYASGVVSKALTSRPHASWE